MKKAHFSLQKMAIWGSTHKVEHIEDVVALLRKLQESGVQLFVEYEFARFVEDVGHYSVGKFLIGASDDVPQVDAAVCFGGDGTFLRTVHRMSSVDVPVWAVNCGRLGFLMDVDAGEALDYVPPLLAQEYRVEERTMLHISVDGVFVGNALNELAVQKRETGSLIQVAVRLDNVPLAHYDADGLVISTPTGSTAYSLSLGGPIISPDCSVIVLTPIASHSLNVRPFVIPAHQAVQLEISSRSDSFAAVIDGELRELPCGTPIEITCSEQRARLIRLKDKPFAHTLRDKMLWGEDRR